VHVVRFVTDLLLNPSNPLTTVFESRCDRRADAAIASAAMTRPAVVLALASLLVLPGSAQARTITQEGAFTKLADSSLALSVKTHRHRVTKIFPFKYTGLYMTCHGRPDVTLDQHLADAIKVRRNRFDRKITHPDNESTWFRVKGSVTHNGQRTRGSVEFHITAGAATCSSGVQPFRTRR
jgi:hypothetical protein